MHYIMVLRASDEYVNRCEANSIEEATQFFIRRKQMNGDSFNSLYKVIEDRGISDKKG